MAEAVEALSRQWSEVHAAWALSDRERLATVKLHSAFELEQVIHAIFNKSLNEPHFCETAADMVYDLKIRYPALPAENENEKPQSFTRVLLSIVQNELVSLPETFEPTEEEKAANTPEDLLVKMKKRKGKAMALMKLIGNLFSRQLLSVKVIDSVVHDFVCPPVSSPEQLSFPEEHKIECVCEFLQATGFTLDSTDAGKQLMNKFEARLKDLKGSMLPNGRPVFSARIQFLVQNLLDVRANAWKKVFVDQAKTEEPA